MAGSRQTWIVVGIGIGIVVAVVIGIIVRDRGGSNAAAAAPASIFKQALMPTLKPGAFNQLYEGQGTVDAFTFNPYYNTRTAWRSSGIPHAPMTFRPDNPDDEDYGSQNVVKWDLEKTMQYFPYRSYNDYGMWEYM